MKVASENLAVSIDQISKAQWDKLLPEFDDASIYQTWSYGAVRWGDRQLSHLIIEANGCIIAAAQLRVIKVPFIKAGIAYLSWGPLWRRKGRPIDPDVFRRILDALKEEYAIRRGLLLRIRPNIVEEGSEEIVAVLHRAGFRKNTKVESYRTLMLDLSPDIAEIRKSLDQKWRNQLNRAERNDLKIIEGSGDELYEAFLQLQQEMHDRKRYVPGVNYNEFRNIQRDLSEPLKMKIFICEYEGKNGAAAIGSTIGERGIYLLGATGNEGMKMKGAYLLQWRFLQVLKETGCKSYDLGGIDPDGNPGVYHFKSGISRREMSHVGQFELCRSVLSRLIVESIEALRGFGTNGKEHLHVAKTNSN